MIVPVKHLKQSNDYNCGVTSLAVISDYSIEVLEYYDKDTTKRLGISHEGIYKITKKIGLKLHYQYNSTLKNLREKINSGLLCIVNYQAGGGHYSVVCGYDKKNIFIMDVTVGKIKKIPNQKFLKVWYSKLYGYRWMAWI